ncbi:kinase-like protein [Sistotremastrum suecicum HHB10207 ss-3]|uniref:Kinase-like protein n=1 Tax=Sistotremastrum suecicum HHB10207 ss-3 TaxID=1314776 RepID=A0A166BQ67_9AGAM|nr:kinase-like protein [Sistotremastrum suecicum HHB10207 ss-3]
MSIADFEVNVIALRQKAEWKGKVNCMVNVQWEDTARGTSGIETETGDVLDDGEYKAILINQRLPFGIKTSGWGPERSLGIDVNQTIHNDDDEGSTSYFGFDGTVSMTQVFANNVVEGWFPLTNWRNRTGPGVDVCLKIIYTPRQPSIPSEPALSASLASYTRRRNPERLHDLTGQVEKTSSSAFAWGGFSDVWQGIWKDGTGSHKVAIKIIRNSLGLSKDDEGKLQRRLRREIKVWQSLDHPNVVTLCGICTNFGTFPSMVSLWHDKGSASSYLASLGDRATVRTKLKLLTEVARGLEYLHSLSPPIIHGDLKGPNVLINDKEEACLTDFGLSKIDEVAASVSFTTSTFSATVRWMAREMAEATSEDKMFSPTEWTDIWAYGNVIIEIMTDQVPYYDKKNEPSVIVAIARGITPKIPAGIVVHPDLQDVMKQCWNAEPTERPPMTEVVKKMERLWKESEHWDSK